MGSIVRRKLEPETVYIVGCFFKGKSDNQWQIGGFPPTIWDSVEDVELCPFEVVPQYIIRCLSEDLGRRIQIYSEGRQEQKSIIDRLLNKNKLLKEALGSLSFQSQCSWCEKNTIIVQQVAKEE